MVAHPTPMTADSAVLNRLWRSLRLISKQCLHSFGSGAALHDCTNRDSSAEMRARGGVWAAPQQQCCRERERGCARTILRVCKCDKSHRKHSRTESGVCNICDFNAWWVAVCSPERLDILAIPPAMSESGVLSSIWIFANLTSEKLVSWAVFICNYLILSEVERLVICLRTTGTGIT